MLRAKYIADANTLKNNEIIPEKEIFKEILLKKDSAKPRAGLSSQIRDTKTTPRKKLTSVLSKSYIGDYKKVCEQDYGNISPLKKDLDKQDKINIEQSTSFKNHVENQLHNSFSLTDKRFGVDKTKISPQVDKKIIKIKKGPSFSFRIKKLETSEISSKIYNETFGKIKSKIIEPETILPNIKNQKCKTNDTQGTIVIQKHQEVELVKDNIANVLSK